MHQSSVLASVCAAFAAACSTDKTPDDPGSGGRSATDASGLAAACPSPGLEAGDTTESVQVGSASRNYVLHVPSQYSGTTPVPLVVDFHPLGGSGSGERAKLALPNAHRPGRCDHGLSERPRRALGERLERGSLLRGPRGRPRLRQGGVGGPDQRPPASTRSPSTPSASQWEAACRTTSRATRPTCSPRSRPLPSISSRRTSGDCAPPRPVTVISFRGTSDPIVPYAGGYSGLVSGHPVSFLGAVGTFQKWAELDGCTGSPSTTDSDGCQTYSSCQGGVEVILCTKQGGGHEAANATVGWPVLGRHTMP